MKKLKSLKIITLICITAVLFSVPVLAAVSETETTEIASFSNYGDNGNYDTMDTYEVAYGTSLEEVTNKLPDTLTAKTPAGEEIEVPVTWRCIDDGVGGTSYVAEHADATAAYRFEAQLTDGYTLGGNMPENYQMPYVTVSYTQDAQQLNSTTVEDGNANTNGNDMIGDEAAAGNGTSTWTWIIWIVVIIVVVVILWWIMAGSKGKGRGDDQP